jgi:hypothetical protein
MVNALTLLFYAAGLNKRRLMMNKSLRGRGRESSRKSFYGFRQVAAMEQKKSRRCRRL